MCMFIIVCTALHVSYNVKIVCSQKLNPEKSFDSLKVMWHGGVMQAETGRWGFIPHGTPLECHNKGYADLIRSSFLFQLQRLVL